MHLFQRPFHASALYHEDQGEPLVSFLKRRWAFWLALLSCMAFLIGNMVGQHGWHSFWKSVWGKESDIVFQGTVMPVSGYPLPPYREVQSCDPVVDEDDIYYPVRYLGDYRFGGDGCGSHPAVDIKLPMGTDIVAVANGIIESVDYRDWGFGNSIVLLVPNAPDAQTPSKLVTYYVGYAHLSAILVKPGDIVKKGQIIGRSGQTGDATTPHLHFQIDTAAASFHPYWSFTMNDVRVAGLSTLFDGVNASLGISDARLFTISPLLYVQKYANGSDSTPVIADIVPPQLVVVEKKLTWREQLQEKILSRLARRERTPVVIRTVQPPEQSSSSVSSTATSSSSQAAVEVAQVVPTLQESLASSSASSSTVVQVKAEASVPITPDPLTIRQGQVSQITLFHDGEITADREGKIVLYARDVQGNFVHDVSFSGTLSIESGFGEAVFTPATLTATDFDDRGRAFVTVTSLSKKTVIPVLRGAFQTEGMPMRVSMK